MYTNDIKDKFIELRAQGRSLCAIAAELKVSKHTLVDWNQQFREQIRQLRAVELEALYDKILLSRERELKWMVSFEEQMADLMTKRGFKWMKNRDLLRFILLYRREIAQLQAEVLAPLDQPPAPRAAPSGQNNGTESSPAASALNSEPQTQRMEPLPASPTEPARQSA